MSDPNDRPAPRLGSDARTVRDDPTALRAEVWVRDFALVTYRVPPARLQGLVPTWLQPQTVDDPSGRTWALVSASSFLNDDLGWAGGPSPRICAHQATFRTYVRRGDDVGAYFFSSYLGTTTSTLLQRLGLADSRRATFHVDVERTPDGAYRTYRSEMDADDGRAVLHVTATEPPPATPPFASGDDHVRFITHRLHGWSTTLAGVVVDAQVEHPEMAAYGGRLLEGRFPALDRLGLVPFAEQADPYSVLVSPGTRFELLAPVPVVARG